jgi:hypothetical protein
MGDSQGDVVAHRKIGGLKGDVVMYSGMWCFARECADSKLTGDVVAHSIGK